MADCSKTEEFFKEMRRACKMQPLNCMECPADEFCDFMSNETPETDGLIEVTQKAINNLQKWSDEHPREIDWSKVPVDTPVLVWDTYRGAKEERYFAMYMPAAEFKYRVFDHENKLAKASLILGYNYCELAPEIDPTPYYKEMA